MRAIKTRTRARFNSSYRTGAEDSGLNFDTGRSSACVFIWPLDRHVQTLGYYARFGGGENMKLLCVFLMIALPSIAFADVNSVFIGNFKAFDPYRLGPIGLRMKLPEFDNNRLFVWLECNESEQQDLEGVKLLSYGNSEIYVANGPVGYNDAQLDTGTAIYFVYEGRTYETKIEQFILVKPYGLAENLLNTYADCPIPDSLKENKSLSSGFFPIICSLQKKIQVYYDKFNVQKTLKETARVQEYRIESFLQDTGQKGHYGEPVYKSRFSVRYRDKVIYDTGEKTYPFKYIIGDFDGNGKVDLYLYYSPWGRIYRIIEFDRSKVKMKEYIQYSEC